MVKAKDLPSGHSCFCNPCGRFDCTGRSGTCDPFEFTEIVADGHGERQQSFERFAGGSERDRNISWRHGHSFRQVSKVLAEDGDGRFDQNFRLDQRSLMEGRHGLGESLAAAPLVMGLVAGSQAPQVGNQFRAVRHAAGSDLAGDTGLQDLLRAPAADFEERLQRFAVDPRPSEGVQLRDGIV